MFVEQYLTKATTQRPNQVLWLDTADFAFFLDIGTIDKVPARHTHQATVETFRFDNFA